MSDEMNLRDIPAPVWVNDWENRVQRLEDRIGDFEVRLTTLIHFINERFEKMEEDADDL